MTPACPARYLRCEGCHNHHTCRGRCGGLGYRADLKALRSLDVPLAPWEEVLHVHKDLVPLDGTSEAMDALTPAQTVATATAGTVICLLKAIAEFVAYMTTSGSGFGDGSPYFDENWDGEALEAANRYVSGMAARLHHAGIQAEGKAVAGPAVQSSRSVAESIIKTADEVDADFIVMSTHALTGPGVAR